MLPADVVRYWAGEGLQPTRSEAHVRSTRRPDAASAADHPRGATTGCGSSRSAATGPTERAQRIFDVQYRFIQGEASLDELESIAGGRVAGHEVESNPDRLIDGRGSRRCGYPRGLPGNRRMSPCRRCLVCGLPSRPGITTRQDVTRRATTSTRRSRSRCVMTTTPSSMTTGGRSASQTPGAGERSGPRLTLVERVERRLRRLAVDVGRFAAAHPEYGWIARLAACLKRWADELASDIAARDRRDPDWRLDDAFYPRGLKRYLPSGCARLFVHRRTGAHFKR